MWEKVKLGDVTVNLDSKRKPLNQTQRNKIKGEGKYPYIGANNIQDYVDEYLFDEKILCVSEDGGSWGANETCAKIYNEKCWVNNHAHVLTEIRNKIRLEYLMYYLNHADLNMFINGATRGKLTKKTLENIEIPLPPLPIQERIAEILDKADELRRKDQELQDKYDQLAQAIFIDMFGDPVKNEKGWEVKNIEQLVSKDKHSIKRGPFGGALKKEIFVKSGYLVYEQYHALNNDFSMERYFIDKDKYQELIAFKVLPKDIIISCSGVYLGKLAIIPEDAKEGIINQALLKIRLNENIMRNEFFVFHFSQKNFREKYFDANRGAGIPNFPPMPEFKRFPFICPPIHLQEEFAKKIEIINQLKAQTNAEKSEELFQSLLQKAFKGELVS